MLKDNIKKARLDAGLTQLEVAEAKSLAASSAPVSVSMVAAGNPAEGQPNVTVENQISKYTNILHGMFVANKYSLNLAHIDM